ncbi:MAG: hypothetical protein ACXQS4_03665 [Methermicoccaceae archaeon]
MIATTMCPKCGHEYCVCVGEKYERCCGEWHLIGYEFSSYLPLAELKRRIYEGMRESVYDGIPKQKLCQSLQDVFGLSQDDAEGMLEELKDALGLYCPDGEHLRRVG